MKKFDIVEGNRKMTVLIPPTGDKIWDRDLEQMGREKTRQQLKDNQRKLPTKSKKEVSGALRDYNNFLQAKKECRKRFY